MNPADFSLEESLELFELASDAEELERLEAELCRRSLFEFIKKTWSIVEPKVEFVSNWHIEEICGVLEAITRGDITRCIVNVPPGTMKSLLILVFWPAWEWANDPTLRYLTASYASSRTIDANIKVRNIVQSEWYQKHFDVKLTSDQNAKELFRTSEKGERLATSVDGEGTGIHPDRIIIDDPISADAGQSDEKRKGANDWFDQTISTRGITRRVRLLLVMQRLHQQDLTGHILGKMYAIPGLWKHVCFPMEYEVSREPSDSEPKGFTPDPLDRRTEEGELLWPTLFPREVVNQLKLDLGPHNAAGQLQQRPTARGGGLFKRAWFEVVDVLPKGKTTLECRGWDTGATEGAGDPTCGVLLAEVDGVVYVRDMVMDQLGPSGSDELILNTAKADGRYVAQREEKEPGASGKNVISAHAKMLRGYDYEGITVSKDKVTRARPFRSQCEARNVKLVRGPWNNTYLQALEDFPTGTMDHPVDASSCAYNAMVEDKTVVGVMWGNRSKAS